MPRYQYIYNLHRGVQIVSISFFWGENCNVILFCMFCISAFEEGWILFELLIIYAQRDILAHTIHSYKQYFNLLKEMCVNVLKRRETITDWFVKFCERATTMPLYRFVLCYILNHCAFASEFTYLLWIIELLHHF